MIGTVIKDQYRILELIGEGGMGIVFKALDVELERQVALKFLKAELGNNSVLIQRFRDELRTLAGFNHPNITTLFTSLTWEARPVMVMELVEGQTLSDMVANRGPIPSQICVPLIKQALSGVALAHRKKIIHRDIKPANLMLNTDGVVKVMDFGIAKIQNAPGLTRSNAGIGTSYYMAPEQIRGAADARTDIYAMGITLYELLAGQVPFQGASQYDIEHAHISTAPEPPTMYYPHIPAYVVDAVMRSLEKDPSARFQTADEFSAALSDGLHVASSSSPESIAVTERPVYGGITPSTTPIPHVSFPDQKQTPTLSSTSPGAETHKKPPLNSENNIAPYPWPEPSSVRATDHAVQSSTPQRKKKLVFAGAAAATVLLLSSGAYWIYTLVQPKESVIDYNHPSGSSGTLSKKEDRAKSIQGDTKPIEPQSANSPASEPIFQLPSTPSAKGTNPKEPVHSATPIIATNDPLSGNWTGRYQNLCSQVGSTQVRILLTRKSSEMITGNMSFSGQGLGGSCSLRGKIHPSERSLTLSPLSCGGTVPTYFQGNHTSTLMFANNKMSGSVGPEEQDTCVQVSLTKAN
jgi:serine/threonine protein kinase